MPLTLPIDTSSVSALAAAVARLSGPDADAAIQYLRRRFPLIDWPRAVAGAIGGPSGAGLTTYQIFDSAASAAAADQVSFENPANSGRIVRFRRFELLNPGSQTAAGARQWTLQRYSTVTGNNTRAALHLFRRDPNNEPGVVLLYGGGAQVGNLTPAFRFIFWVPAAIGPRQESMVFDLSAVNNGKGVTLNPGENIGLHDDTGGAGATSMTFIIDMTEE